ncbi:hypothetical protein JXR01_02055 [Candidatus Kaiserbacteria bacterium]|nr:MAG: hypothetical protein JXR01_02055 [Candidatus Kaiserbacteria bacterium]
MATSAWARKRQMIYGGGLLLFVFSIIAPIVFFTTYKPATCFDGKLNQDETAIDRGGSCQLLDERFIQPYAVLWARTFPVRDGFYNTVAYIENPNQGAGVYDGIYQFKLYDEKNILIAERFGRAPVLPEGVFPVFESRIDTGNRIPARTLFSFVNDLTWERMQDPAIGISIRNEKISDTTSMPRLDAIVHNSEVVTINDIVLVATVFDTAGNAFTSSRTLVEAVGPNEEFPIAFTWPEPFGFAVGRVDIVPLILPQRPR